MIIAFRVDVRLNLLWLWYGWLFTYAYWIALLAGVCTLAGSLGFELLCCSCYLRGFVMIVLGLRITFFDYDFLGGYDCGWFDTLFGEICLIITLLFVLLLFALCVSVCVCIFFWIAG